MLAVKSERKVMTCISRISGTCKKKFLTTKEKRICTDCKVMAERESEEPSRQDFDPALHVFWKNLR